MNRRGNSLLYIWQASICACDKTAQMVSCTFDWQAQEKMFALKNMFFYLYKKRKMVTKQIISKNRKRSIILRKVYVLKYDTR